MFAYLSKKLEMPQGANVRCLAWSSEDGYLACGCENGLLKILKIETAQQTSEGAVARGFLSAPTNITMNQTLEGHTSNIQVVAWNNIHQKLTTSDAKGLIIVWMLYKGSWYEEMVNNRNRSTVRGLAWSSDGSKICIAYEDGGVIVGSADGNRLWGKEIKGPTMTGVTWSPDAKTLVFTFSSGEIQVYDCNGAVMNKIPFEQWKRFERDDGEPIVAVRWHSGKYTGDADSPTLAVIWRAGYMSLLRTVNDDDPLMISTKTIATCGDWSPNGFYIAIGGSPTKQIKTSGPEFEHVNIFNKYGKFLQQIKIPGSPCRSVAWDTLSLRLAIGSGACVYFANLRPLYKFAYFGSNIFSYAFTRPDGTNHLAFWDTEKLSTQEIPGKILELKGDEEHCVILSYNASGAYNVSVLNAVGAPVDSLTILSIEPFTLALTETVLICLASNAVLIWRYQSASSQNIFNDTSKRRERMFHIDDTPSMVSEDYEHSLPSREQTDFTKRPTNDQAFCLDAVSDTLVIGRESGKFNVYSLPTGGLLHIMDFSTELAGVGPSKLWINTDTTQMAVLSTAGHLSLCSLTSNSMKQSKLKRIERKDIWSVIWARDNPNLLCLMEKTRMYVMRDGEFEEPVLTSGYLAYFKNLEISLILMDELMQNPESPTSDHLIKVEARALRDTRSLIENNTDLADVSRYVEENSHPSLWRLLAQAALNQLELAIAETAFVRCKDYAGVQLSKRISNISNDLIRKAEVASFFGDLDKAESYYLEADRKDLAAEMWKLIGEWKRVENVSLPTTRSPRPSDKSSREMNIALGEMYAEKQEWAEALKYFELAGDSEHLVDCYLMLEDYTSLNKLATSLPENSSLLPQIGAAFEAVGLTHEAVNAYLLCDMADRAIETAIMLSQWNLAMELAQRHTISNVSPVLLRYTGHLLENGEIMQAVELLRKSDKPYAAGKLLGMLALRELRTSESLRPILVKKLFFLSALMFVYKTRRFFRDKAPSRSAKTPTESQMDVDVDADLSFEEYIPEEFRPNVEEYRWMRENPWRGVEAVHLLSLTQRHLYTGKYENATKSALYLRFYKDIIGEERVGALLALSAANSKCFNICSRAFIQLEAMDSDYTEIASDMYSDHLPKDLRTRRINCFSCNEPYTDNNISCTSCGALPPICMATGRPILDANTMYFCDTCSNATLIKEMDSCRVCPVCHSAWKMSQKDDRSTAKSDFR